MEQLEMVLGFVFVTLMSFAIFYISFKKEPRRLLNGFLFNVFLFLLFGTTMMICLSFSKPILTLFVVVIILLLLSISFFGIYIVIFYLLKNARMMKKKESRTLQNKLTFILALLLIGYFLFSMILPQEIFGKNIFMIKSLASFLYLYYLLSVFNFLTISFLYKLRKYPLNQDFIIVLGSRVIGDKVSPLLAGRIDRAIEFYTEQKEIQSPPKIIFSGGQGKDEQLSEALAMQRYAIANGVAEEDTIIEDKSTTTYENMLFSKRIMDELWENETENIEYNCLFSTNDYHLLRAGFYAKEVGISAQGISAKTARYYYINAMIREYIAIAYMNKKRHAVVVGASVVLGIVLFILQNYFTI
ncbi:MAG: YdcF family protein [Clostridioides sp.]|jgi:uncharacterized SAM-binding protein YcdF (DUF218 family)|nr:YdcF family protein [Clostridioides sp.]